MNNNFLVPFYTLGFSRAQLKYMTPLSFPTGPALGLLRRVMEGPLL